MGRRRVDRDGLRVVGLRREKHFADGQPLLVGFFELDQLIVQRLDVVGQVFDPHHKAFEGLAVGAQARVVQGGARVGEAV